MPKIAQKGVDESSLQFTELDFLNPTESSITLTQRGILYSPSIFTPTLDSFNASLYLVTNGTLAAEPMMYIPMPSIHALHPQGNVSIENQVIPIANLDRLTDFATAVLANEYVTTALSGSTNLHEGSLPVVNVNYNSQTTYKGKFHPYLTTVRPADQSRTQWLGWFQCHWRKSQPIRHSWRAKSFGLCIYS